MMGQYKRLLGLLADSYYWADCLFKEEKKRYKLNSKCLKVAFLRYVYDEENT